MNAIERGRWPTLNVLTILPAARSTTEMVPVSSEVTQTAFRPEFVFTPSGCPPILRVLATVPEAMSTMLTGGVVFVGDIELLAIFADVEVFRVGAAVNDSEKLVLTDIEDSDAIGALVGRRKSALIDTGAGDGRSAQRYVERLAIRTRVNSARSLAERNGGDDVQRAGVDDGQISGDFVGHVDARSRRFGDRCSELRAAISSRESSRLKVPQEPLQVIQTLA